VKSTVALAIMGDYTMDDRTIHIHPNDGFDLGLMSTEYTVRIYVGSDALMREVSDSEYVYGKLHLKNSVRHGHMELGLRAANKLGSSRMAKVFYEPGGRFGKVRVAPAS